MPGARTKPLQWEWIVVGLVVGVSVWMYAANLRANRGQVFEDSYITFRYAQHLAGGHGLVWNIGGAPTEGFTNLLLVAIVAALAPIQAEPLVVVRTISVVSTLLIALLLGNITYNFLKLPLFLATLTACLWLTYFPTALHSVYGLETVLFTCLLLILALQSFRYETRRRPGDLLLLLGVGTLLLLTRPEGIAYMGLALLWLLVQPHRNVRQILMAGLVYGFIVIAWFGLRYLYFGYWLPNPFLIKTGRTDEQFPGLIYVIYFLVDIGLLMPWALISLFQRHPVLRFSAMIAFFGVFFYALVRHEMGIHHRFLFPTFPLWLMMAASGIQPLLQLVEKVLKHPRTATVSYGTLLVMSILLHPHELIEHEPNDVRWARLAFNTPNVPDGAVAINHEMGTVLKSLGLGNDVVCLNEDAGVMPYISGCSHVDPVGLNDNVVARTTAVEAYTDYLFGTAPDVMFLRSYDPDWNVEREIACPFGSHGKLDDFSRAVIYADPRFQAYEIVGSVPDGWGYFFHIAVRGDSPFYTPLTRAFTEYILQKQGQLSPPSVVSSFSGPCPPRDSSGKGMQ